MPLEVLYLVRHGKAEGPHPRGDRFRSLSEEGRRRIEEMVPQAQSLGFHADLALSSPYLRAVQTRDCFTPLWPGVKTETSPAFTPDAYPADTLGELKAWEAAGHSRIAVFSHNPFVTELAEYFLVPWSVRDLVFHTPTILALGFDAGLEPHQGRVLWILHP